MTDSLTELALALEVRFTASAYQRLFHDLEALLDEQGYRWRKGKVVRA